MQVLISFYAAMKMRRLPISQQYLDDDGPYTKFLTRALSEIVQERQVTEPIGFIGVILDDIIGEHDRCTINGFPESSYAVLTRLNRPSL